MDAGIASTILFVYPVLVAIIMAVVFKGKSIAGHYVFHSAGLCGNFLAL